MEEWSTLPGFDKEEGFAKTGRLNQLINDLGLLVSLLLYLICAAGRYVPQREGSDSENRFEGRSSLIYRRPRQIPNSSELIVHRSDKVSRFRNG